MYAGTIATLHWIVMTKCWFTQPGPGVLSGGGGGGGGGGLYVCVYTTR